MWIETSIVVGNRPVGLSVHRLEAGARNRAAASLAWFSHAALTGDASGEPDVWQTFMQDVIFEHVRFTIPGMTESQLDGLDTAWWNEASRQAIVAFVEANELSPSLKQHLEAIAQLNTAGTADRPRLR